MASSSSSSIVQVVNNLLSENPLLNQAKIRIDKATQKASVIDVIRIVTGLKSGDASNVLKRLDDKVTKNCRQLRINGKGRLTWVADAPTLVELIWELPGKAAKAFRRQSAHYICRILGGDVQLAQEIENRYKNASPEQKQFFMQNTKVPNKETSLDLRRKRLELDSLELKNLKGYIELMDTLGMDTRDTISCKDLVRQKMLMMKRSSDTLMIEGPNKKLRSEISIPLVASELGINTRNKGGVIGKLAVQLWRKKHGHSNSVSPPKRSTMFRGRPIFENAYYSEDREAILTIMN